MKQLNRLIQYLNNRIDKVVHFLFGFILVIILIKALLFLGIDIQYSWKLIFILGFVKEFYDNTCRNSPFDLVDAICTGLGGILAYVIY